MPPGGIWFIFRRILLILLLQFEFYLNSTYWQLFFSLLSPIFRLLFFILFLGEFVAFWYKSISNDQGENYGGAHAFIECNLEAHFVDWNISLDKICNTFVASFLRYAIVHIWENIVGQEFWGISVVTETTGALILLLQSLHNFHKWHRLGIQIKSFEKLVLWVLQFGLNAFLDIIHVGLVVEIQAFDTGVISTNWVICVVSIDNLDSIIIFEDHWISGTWAFFTAK